MHGFGPVVRGENEPVFNIDEFRRTIERMPPASYLAATYYERWLHALETLLLEKGVISSAELEAAISGAREAGAPGDGYGDTASDSAHRSNVGASAALNRGGEEASLQPSGIALRYNRSYKPSFTVGDEVVARNMNPE